MLDDFDTDTTGPGWSPGCVSRFWDAHPGLLAALVDKGRTPPATVAQQLIDVIVDARKTYGSVVLLSDYTAYDVAWINSLLLRTGFTTINMATGEWLSTLDTDSYGEGVRDALGNAYIPFTTRALTHFPDDDAKGVALSYWHDRGLAGII